ncbi:MAG: exodeoxyribonuclease III [Rickettsiaceae bacterium]|nr:exodeoxyribonuclease III [Rickettsiaceae bacterium]
MSFKIVTWNINSIKIRLNHLREFITEHNPDIICLQELKCETDKFPSEELSDLPYNLYIHGQKSYNGVAILSKIPADEVITKFPDNPIPEQARFIECSFDTPIGFLRVISLYAPNGGEVGSEKFAIKLDFYDAFINYIKSKKSFEEKLFIGADYNIAPFDTDVYSPDNLRDTTCFTLTEQRKLRTILNDGFVDNFRAKHPHKRDFSWWDYRAGAFEQNNGMRIDTIISTSNALQNLEDCIIDYKTREKRQPSDHAPVIGIYTQRT